MPGGNNRARAAAPVLCIVDDDASTVDLVREVAEESGWVAYDFSRIDEVRRFLDRRHPALLILDDDLPDGRGGDLGRELRDDPATAGVATVEGTAANARRKGEIGGWAAVISKPFDLAEIEDVLHARAPRARRTHGESAAR
ncbi:MAG: response regulator [Chloroflexota bacterium]